MTDRWCKGCNAYQSTERCAHCTARTEELVVWQPERKAKLRCACRAPFEGIRPSNQSGLPLSMRYEGKLLDRELTVEVAWESADDIGGSLACDSALPRALACPHCSRPLVRARVTWPIRLPMCSTLALVTRPDAAVLLAVHARRGFLHA